MYFILCLLKIFLDIFLSQERISKHSKIIISRKTRTNQVNNISINDYM